MSGTKRWRRPAPARTWTTLMLWGVMCATGSQLRGQTANSGLTLVWADGTRDTVPVSREMGYAAAPVEVLERLGWNVQSAGLLTAAGGPEGVVLTMRPATPVVRWGEEFVQLADAPYLADGRLWVPLQLVVDELPGRLPDLYAYDPSAGALRAADPDAVRAVAALPELPAPAGDDRAAGPDEDAQPAEAPPAAAAVTPAERAPASPEPAAEPMSRLVIIDAGHGGGDPGALGRGGVRERT